MGYEEDEIMEACFEWIAGQALVGILASRSNVYETVFNAEMAYCNADAMLAERSE